MPSLLAVYDNPGSVADVARRLKNRGYGDLEVYAPAAFPELIVTSSEKGWGIPTLRAIIATLE